ncbi:MAG: hypothetical protein J6P09_08550 [Methanobrevibacter sp.]|nr:hypothetical protein [Methanobrevibacter sp.]
MKMNKILFVFSISIILLASMSLISASTNENLTLTDSADSDMLLEDASATYSSLNLTSVQSQDDKIKSANDNYIINQRNYKMYFDEAGVLKNEYSGKILTFDGTFTDKGILTINSDNTKITGRNTLFNNTGFNIKADGVMLTNLKFVLNESFTANSNAGIYITGNNVTLYNIDMSYDTPSDVDAIGVYSYDNTGFKLINSSFNYIGHAFHEGHNYPILLQYSDDALVSGNDISSTLPLREVDWSGGIYGGVGMDKVSSFAAGDSKNLQFTGNNVYSTVNFGEYADNKYPTLSSVLIYACDNSTINKNDIKVEDLHTRKNTANYLYALDIYRLNDVEVVENNIDVFTYGGNGRYGTAYPIQVTGPAYNIKVAYNYLHSVSNGPNIGVYSQNYYGSTQIDVISNFINITGKAGTDSWALVAGIEVQDSDDRILNNTIIVDTVGGYKAGDRVYGISYSQNTQGNHKYDIKYNKVTTPGPIAISLNQGLGSTTSDTNVMYNILVTGVGEGGDRAVSIGGNGQNNVVRYNTNGADTIRHMSERDIPSWLKNYNSGGVGNGNGVDLSWLNTGNNAGNGLGNGEGSGNSLSGKGQGSGLTIKSKVNGNNINPSTSDAIRGDANSTRYTYGESGISIASASSSAGSGSSSSSSPSESKAYEITKQIQELDKINYIQTIIGIILVLILLIIGYREKERTEEEY